MILDGFGVRAREFADWLENQRDLHFLRYGFSLRKTDFSENVYKEPKDDLLSRIEEELHRSDDPMDALIEGVDEGWEVCLMKFTMDMINRSAPENLSEWKRRGLI